MVISMKKFPIEIQNFLNESKTKEISIGCSNTKVYQIIKKNNQVYYLKVGKAPLLTKEYASLMWLKNKLKVPECIIFTNDGTTEYMITKAVLGEMSCSEQNLKAPEKTIKLLAKAILNLQEIDIKDCPFRNDINYKLGIAEFNVKNKLLTEPMVSTLGKKFNSYEDLLKYLKDNKPNEQLVFSHGDTSMPNIFLYKNNVSGFIDMGECGVSDKWFDIAIACKSIRRNFNNEQYSNTLINLFLKELNLEYSTIIDYYEAIMDLYL